MSDQSRVKDYFRDDLFLSFKNDHINRKVRKASEGFQGIRAQTTMHKSNDWLVDWERNN